MNSKSTSRSVSRLNCKNCDDFFFTDIELDRHLNLDHDIQTELKFCKKCKVPYKDEHNHCSKDNVYPSQTEKFLCNECGKYCTSKQLLQKHIEVIHEEVKHGCGQIRVATLCGKIMIGHYKYQEDNVISC